MRQFNFSFILFFTIIGMSATAQTPIAPVKTNGKFTVPFKVTAYNNIIIKCVLNSSDTVNLMMHTAASDVTLTEDAFVKLKTVKLNGSVDSVKSWGGGVNSSDFSKNNFLNIEGLGWKDVTVWKDKNSGQESDGKFGLNLFENKIIDLDFDKKILTVEIKLPRKIQKYDKFQLITKNNMLFIRAVCQTGKDTFVNDFLIHSGYGGGVLLDDKFVGDNKIGQLITIIGEKKLKDAYGNVLTTKKGILPFFSIGKLQLANAPVGFFEGAIGRQKMSMIGGDIIKRFNWIIDAKNGFVYLKPNNLFKTDFTNI